MNPTLDGIRRATTGPQLALIERATTVLRAVPGMLAGWLVGSFATGEADPWSDVDLHCLVSDELADAVTRDELDLVAAIGPTVQRRRIPNHLGWACLTPDWIHFDLVLYRESDLDPTTVYGLRRLFDNADVLPADFVPRRPVGGHPYFPHDAVDWYFYLLGNLVTVVGRGEWTLATNGAVTIRDTALVPLLLAERGIHRIGGNKRLYPLLTPEQIAVLEGMGPLVPTLASVLDAEMYLARTFIPRGRRLATVTGAEWPAALETATLRHVREGLGVPFEIE